MKSVRGSVGKLGIFALAVAALVLAAGPAAIGGEAGKSLELVACDPVDSAVVVEVANGSSSVRTAQVEVVALVSGKFVEFGEVSVKVAPYSSAEAQIEFYGVVDAIIMGDITEDLNPW